MGQSDIVKGFCKKRVGGHIDPVDILVKFLPKILKGDSKKNPFPLIFHTN